MPCAAPGSPTATEDTMHARHAVVPLVLIALLAGCSTISYSPPPGPRSMKDCRGVVTCDVDVDPSGILAPEEIFTSRGAATLIRWKLDPNGDWRWRGRGIEFETAADPVIDCPAIQMGPVRTCTKKQVPTAGRFYYAIRLINWRTGAWLDWDPFVINE
jgi:hypothetical protein